MTSDKVVVVNADVIKLFGNSDDLNIARYDSDDKDFKIFCASMDDSVKAYLAKAKSSVSLQSTDTASTANVSARQLVTHRDRPNSSLKGNFD
jgi:hypothetical protein